MRNGIIVAAVGVALVGTLVVALGFAAVLGLGVGGVPSPAGFLADDGGGYEETTLHRFETTGPACPGENGTRSGIYARPTPDGHRLSVVDNVSVSSTEVSLDASFSEIGPGRYRLDLSRRTADAESTESGCEPEIKYNATMNVSRPDDYTIIVTLDGELKQVLWSERTATGGAAGASKSVSAGDGSSGGSASASAGDNDSNATAAHRLATSFES